jgi:hypothetical protein
MLGGSPISWPGVDRFVVDENGLATERVSYFDPLPLMGAAALRPKAWPDLASRIRPPHR